MGSVAGLFVYPAAGPRAIDRAPNRGHIGAWTFVILLARNPVAFCRQTRFDRIRGSKTQILAGPGGICERIAHVAFLSRAAIDDQRPSGQGFGWCSRGPSGWSAARPVPAATRSRCRARSGTPHTPIRSPSPARQAGHATQEVRKEVRAERLNARCEMV